MLVRYMGAAEEKRVTRYRNPYYNKVMLNWVLLRKRLFPINKTRTSRA